MERLRIKEKLLAFLLVRCECDLVIPLIRQHIEMDLVKTLHAPVNCLAIDALKIYLFLGVSLLTALMVYQLMLYTVLNVVV